MNGNHLENINTKSADSDKSKERRKDRAYKFPEEKLSMLLRNNTLKKEDLIKEASKYGYDICVLGALTISWQGLRKEYVEYKNANKNIGRSDEEILFSFLEKIQSQTESPQSTPKVVEPTKPESMIVPKEELVIKSQPIKIAQKQEPIPSAKTKESFPKPEKKNWWEVKRETEVMAIEDLDGNMRTFEKHVRELKVARKDSDGHWQWTGGNKKLVFLGDILGDRQMDGMAITNIIFDLADQAEKQGGQVDFLCGNHDMDFIRFLCQEAGDGYARRNAELLTKQSKGTWELAKFDATLGPKMKMINPFKEEFKNDEENLWDSLYSRMPDILNKMSKDLEGKKFLENICKVKVAIIHDDTIFCHTDPTTRMIYDLTSSDNIVKKIEELNNLFQNKLRKILFDGEKPDAEFKKIAEIYFNANNREYFVELESYKKLAENMFSKLMEKFFKNKKIIFNKDIEDELNKNGVSNKNWEEWERLLFRFLEKIDLDLTTVITTFESWKSENNLEGDFSNSIFEIMKVLIKMRTNINDDKKWHNCFEKFNNLIDLIIKDLENRNPIKDNIEKVKKAGVNAIIHGHSPRNDNRYYYENGLLIVSPHACFSRGRDIKKGVSIVRKDGRVSLIEKNFREKPE